eukprot:365263-Chlamydomonas_euryale.AAC.17
MLQPRRRRGVPCGTVDATCPFDPPPFSPLPSATPRNYWIASHADTSHGCWKEGGRDEQHVCRKRGGWRGESNVSAGRRGRGKEGDFLAAQVLMVAELLPCMHDGRRRVRGGKGTSSKGAAGKGGKVRAACAVML